LTTGIPPFIRNFGFYDQRLATPISGNYDTFDRVKRFFKRKSFIANDDSYQQHLFFEEQFGKKFAHLNGRWKR
jgi:hypothetical protein